MINGKQGYAPYVTRFIRPDEIQARFDVQLQPATATTGTVSQP